MVTSCILERVSYLIFLFLSIFIQMKFAQEKAKMSNEYAIVVE